MNSEILPPVPRGTFLSEVWRFFVNSLAKENYARMRCRAGRMEYWSVTIIGTLIVALLLLFVVIPCNLVRWISFTMFLVAVFYLTMPMLSVYERRLHDVGLSGRWVALLYITYCVPFTYVIFSLSARIGLESELMEYSGDLFHIALVTCREFWLVCVHIIGEILSFFLFIITILPGNKGFNKYDC